MKIEQMASALFPSGYLHYQGYVSLSKSDTTAPARGVGSLPYLCTDLYAITASALQRSGAYHHVAPAAQPSNSLRILGVSKELRRSWVKLGAEWRGDGAKEGVAPPAGLDALWDDFWAHREEDIYATLNELSGPPSWWHPALALMCIADEAARGLGFQPPRLADTSFQSRLIETALQRGILAEEAKFSFSTADTDLICVLPKSRTPTLGCTLRSLSHNLCLLPPRGLARAYWLPYEGSRKLSGDSSTGDRIRKNSLNCLLVPLPYQISAQAFVPVHDDQERWGWFQLRPDWCPRSDEVDLFQVLSGYAEFLRFVSELIKVAERDVGEVHVLIFPEAALSSVVFRRLSEDLRSTNVELLVSGLFDKLSANGKKCEQGNFAALAAIGDSGFISYRQKHHRWRLDGSQIQTYSLGAALDPNYGWWEDIDILSRSLDVYVLRGTTTVTTLICEDLARHDPCQELVRGIGPNLVFALLMDGPQLKARWPARYATILAEDPGSSVLSFTSLGLIERSNGTGMLPKSRSIGLWRDDRGETIELSLPQEAHGLCLSLHATDFEEFTLDGRSDDGASESWRLSGIQPVRSRIADDWQKQILQGKWPSSSP